MNMNMLVNMFTRLIARRAMNWGINRGMDTISRRGKGGKGGTADPDPAQAARQPKTGGQTGQTRDLAKRMRTLARLTRR